MPHTVNGIDGYTPTELLQMPTPLKAQLVQVFNQVERGEPWPLEVLQALVLSAAKSHPAATALDTRPLMVLARLYQVWAISRARTLLHWLRGWLPASMLGFLAGTCT